MLENITTSVANLNFSDEMEVNSLDDNDKPGIIETLSFLDVYNDVSEMVCEKRYDFEGKQNSHTLPTSNPALFQALVGSTACAVETIISNSCRGNALKATVVQAVAEHLSNGN